MPWHDHFNMEANSKMTFRLCILPLVQAHPSVTLSWTEPAFFSCYDFPMLYCVCLYKIDVSLEIVCFTSQNVCVQLLQLCTSPICS